MSNSLSFVLLRSAKNDFFLQWNKHLRSYSFFGGHVDEGESFFEAAHRELAEELGANDYGRHECFERYGLQFPESKSLLSQLNVRSVQALVHSFAQAATIEFYSLRFARQVSREVAMYDFQLEEEDFEILNRLQLLSEHCPESNYQELLNMPIPGLPIVKAFNRSDLIEYGLNQKYNPFIKWAFENKMF